MSHIQRLTFIIGVLWVGAAMMPDSAGAHGLPQQPALAAPTPAPDTSTIAHELQEHHRYLFNEEQLVLLDQANATFEEAAASQGSQANEKHSEGSALLLELLEGHPNFIDVDLSTPGVALMDGAQVLSTPGDSVGVVFRIRNGSGITQCSVAEWDMKRIWENQPGERIPNIA